MEYSPYPRWWSEGAWIIKIGDSSGVWLVHHVSLIRPFFFSPGDTDSDSATDRVAVSREEKRVATPPQAYPVRLIPP